MSEPTIDAKAAARLGMMEPQVAIMRTEWEQSPKSNVIKALISVKLESLMAEKLGKLRKCAPEECRPLQSALDALELALSVVNSRIIT
jgi:hypothetical protein